MKLAVSNLHRVINDYLLQVIVPKLPNNILRFGLAFSANYVGSSFVENYLNKYKPLLETLGVIKNGYIDLDNVRDNALKALKSGCKDGMFEVYGYHFDSADVDAIILIAEKYAESDYETEVVPK